MFRLMRFTVLSTLLLTVLVIQLPSVLTSPLDFATRQLARGDGLEDGKRGAVASESAICSRHGTDIITMGGNAADAVRIFELDRSLLGRYANPNHSDGGHNALRRSCR